MIGDELGGDACVCLRTTQNELSFWAIPELSESALNEAVLAIATSVTADKIDSIHTVCITQDFFNENKYNLNNSPENGNTAVADLQNKHYDLLSVTLPVLNSLGKEIHRLNEASKQLAIQDLVTHYEVHTHTTTEIKNIIIQAIQNDRVTLEQLPEKIRLIINKELEKSPAKQK